MRIITEFHISCEGKKCLLCCYTQHNISCFARKRNGKVFFILWGRGEALLFFFFFFCNSQLVNLSSDKVSKAQLCSPKVKPHSYRLFTSSIPVRALAQLGLLFLARHLLHSKNEQTNKT